MASVGHPLSLFFLDRKGDHLLGWRLVSLTLGGGVVPSILPQLYFTSTIDFKCLLFGSLCIVTMFRLKVPEFKDLCSTIQLHRLRVKDEFFWLKFCPSQKIVQVQIKTSAQFFVFHILSHTVPLQLGGDIYANFPQKVTQAIKHFHL